MKDQVKKEITNGDKKRMSIIDRIDEIRAKSVSEEEFRKTWGYSLDEHVQKMMGYAKLCQDVTKYFINKGLEPNTRKLTFRELVEFACYFFEEGLSDGQFHLNRYLK